MPVYTETIDVSVVVLGNWLVNEVDDGIDAFPDLSVLFSPSLLTDPIDVSVTLTALLFETGTHIELDVDVSASFDVSNEGLITVVPELLSTFTVFTPNLIEIFPELDGGFVAGSSGLVDITPNFDVIVDVEAVGLIDSIVELSATSHVDATATIDIAPDVYATFTHVAFFTNIIDISPELVFNSNVDYAIVGIVDVLPILSSSQVAFTVDRVITREDRFVNSGVRPSTPLLVYHADVRQRTDVLAYSNVDYVSLVGSFNVGETVTGATSGAIGTIFAVEPTRLVVISVVGVFAQSETITTTSGTALSGDIEDVPAKVPENEHFLISALYDRFADDPFFYELGGGRTQIGKRLVEYAPDGSKITDTMVFRSAQEKEVVGLVGSLTLLRFELDEVWREYNSMPQRFLKGMRVFDLLDPDKIYNYYAQIIGALQSQWSYDNTFMLGFFDPRTCPTVFLPNLAEQYGLPVTERESEAQRRSKIELAIPTFKLKGLDLGLVRRIASLGYSADVLEIWVDPDHQEIFLTEPNASSASYDWRYDNSKAAAPFVSASGTSIVVSGNVTGSWNAGDHIQVRSGSTGQFGAYRIVSTSFAGGNTTIEVGQDTTGVAGTNVYPVLRAWVPIRHGSQAGVPQEYWPSSRMAIWVATAYGEPITSVPQEFADQNPGATLNDFWSFLAADLYRDIIPLHTDIKFFGTRIGAHASMSEPAETLSVDETLNLSNF